MFTGCRKQILRMVGFLLLFGFAGTSMASTGNSRKAANPNKQIASLADRIQHELVMLPYLGVFDNLGFSIEGANTVVLAGQVVRPVLKQYAESAIRQIPGVSKVVNNIEVLPLSPFDDSIRMRTYRAIYSRNGFEKYAMQADPPIRIIVKNGNITLEGVVGNAMDRSLAEMAARSIPGVFSVTDNLGIN